MNVFDFVSFSPIPPTIYVADHIVFWPCLDSVLATDDDAYDLADRWQTDRQFLSISREWDWLVFLPEQLLRPVHHAAKRLALA